MRYCAVHFAYPGEPLTKLIDVAAIAIAIAIAALPLSAQAPYLVSDINTSTNEGLHSSAPGNFRAFGDKLFFQAWSPETGQKLWVYSGGTATMLDITTTPTGPTPTSVHDIGGGVFLVTPLGRQIWRTDGTPAGTAFVKSIIMGNLQVVYGGKLFFISGTAGNAEPWFSDGTSAGTQMLLDLNGTSSSSTVTAMTVLGDKLLIFGDSSLWTSDGTAAGTTRIASNIGQGIGTVRLGNTVYFTGGTTAAGRELWKTDGTAEGTQMVADAVPGAGSGVWTESLLGAGGSTVYFLSTQYTDLWKSDGTAAGTQFVKTLGTQGIGPAGAVVVDSLLFVCMSDGSLWRSDGTDAGTFAIETSGARNLVSQFGRAFYFRPNGAAIELWSTDGTTKNLVATLPTASDMTATGGKLYFTGRDEHGDEPWVSDAGTPETTHRLVNVAADMGPSSTPFQLTASGDVVFFTATDGLTQREIWRSDGTAGGTFRLTSLGTNSNSADVSQLTGRRGQLFFANGPQRRELWSSDGTVAGTTLMKELAANGVSNLFSGSRYLFFSAPTENASALWRSDGTAAGTVTVGNSAMSVLTELAGRGYGLGSASVSSIWFTDGETIERLLNAPSVNSAILNITAAAGAIFFTAVTQEGHELWRSDGSAGSERLVKNIAAGSASSNPGSLTAAGRYLYFVANDGTNGNELWRSDGSEAGTILLKDIGPGANDGAIANLNAAGALLYFTANDGTHGVELWRTDGTPEGTMLAADVRPGAESSNPSSLAFANGALWFSANDGVAGAELWRLAGETAAMVADLEPGTGSSSPTELVQAGSQLFFAATTAAFGRELWAMPLTGSRFDVDDVRVTEGTGGTATARFTITRSGSANGSASIAFATIAGSASGDDFIARSGTLQFADGERSVFVDVVVQSDTAIEGEEAFYLALSSPASATLGRSVGTAVIDDDDRRAELSIVALQQPDYSSRADRWFRITNAGPSFATDLQLRFTESPRDMLLVVTEAGCYSNDNPMTCSLEQLAPGAELLVRVRADNIEGYVDPVAPPPSTVTATVSAAELDSNPSDNTVSNMLSANGQLMMPAVLQSGMTAPVTFALVGTWSPSITATLTSSVPEVTVSPASVTIPPFGTGAAYTLTVGAYTGPLRLTLSMGNAFPGTSVVVPVSPTPKLDVAVVAKSPEVLFGETANVSVKIAARRPDGTRPSGLVSLFDPNGTLVEQRSVDAAASTSFALDGLQPGTRTYRVRYHGDANFNALDAVPVTVKVGAWPTTIAAEYPPLFCAGTTQPLTFTVRTSATTDAPTGTIDLTVGSTLVATVALQPTGVAGESRAVVERSYAAGTHHFIYQYRPTGTFAGSVDAGFLNSVACLALNVSATATSTTSVAVNWTPVDGAQSYQVLRFQNRTSSWMVATTSSTSVVDTSSVTPMRTYLYTVVALDAQGSTMGYGAPDLATTMMFDDDPVIARATSVRAWHVQQLRIGANGLRWFGVNTDITNITPFPAGGPVRASDINALRSELSTLRRNLGVAPIVFVDPVLTPGMPLKAIHIQQLRDAVK